MKILVDENIPFARETFGCHGELVRFAGRGLVADDLTGADALITRSITRVGAELFAEHTEKCAPGFVGTCTIGIDHLDIEFLESSGISWAHAPGCNAQSVVDYVISVMAALKADSLPDSVGIVGCGNVGGLLRLRFIQMGLDVRVHDPFLSADQIPELCSLDKVFASEMICLHTACIEDGMFPTRGMIGLNQLNLLPKGALLISAGRGGVIQESALLSFMEERNDVRVVLDVWHREPRINRQLLGRVSIATPHIAGYSTEGKRNGTLQIYQAFCEHFALRMQDVTGPPLVDMDIGSNNCADYVLAAYDPQLDTCRMRRGFALASEQSRSSGQWFDELRRSYPERREMASFKLNTASLSSGQKTELAKRGFTVGQQPVGSLTPGLPGRH